MNIYGLKIIANTIFDGYGHHAIAIALVITCKFNPYPRFFWDYHRARFLEKKSRIIAGDVTVGTYKMKIICADTVSVGLSYGANFKRHMPLCEEICRAEQNYMPFFGTITERAFRKKKSKAWKHIQIDAMLRSGFFFPKNTLGDGPAFWIFFSRIHG